MASVVTLLHVYSKPFLTGKGWGCSKKYKILSQMI